MSENAFDQKRKVMNVPTAVGSRSARRINHSPRIVLPLAGPVEQKAHLMLHAAGCSTHLCSVFERKGREWQQAREERCGGIHR